MVFPLSSMTAFARAEGAHETWQWVWEIKSVNGRGLEQRYRLPPGFDALEPSLRKIVKEKLSRGTVNVSLNLSSDQPALGYRVNEVALETMVEAIEKIRKRMECTPPSPEGVLALRGVLEVDEPLQDEDARAKLMQVIEQSFHSGIDALITSRHNEGALLGEMMDGQLKEVETLRAKAAAHAEASPNGIREKLKRQLAELLDGSAIAEERLAQEAAMLAVKADIREEIDRLDAHISAARALLEREGPVGREFDFLVQEFNREANTLCSKAADMTLKQTGITLKKVIDQMREQVQNIE